MGLIYIFPNEKNPDDDRIVISEGRIELKTYGLPTVFWWYLLAILSVLLVMWIATHDLIGKLIAYPDDITLNFLGHLVKAIFILAPIILFGFFFFEKSLTKTQNKLVISFKLFFITFWRKRLDLKDKDSFFVEHFLSSPNMVRIKNQLTHKNSPEFHKEEMRAFENKGYFELYAETQSGEKFCIDRHARKIDLIKIQKLLSDF